jgi:hypothetical protein
MRLLIALSVLAASCGGTAAPAQRDPHLLAAEALCRAVDEAGRGRPEEAARSFQDGAHDYLHQLAPRVADRDRAAAAGLLEAKARVEQAIGGSAGGDELLQALTELVAAFDRAAATVGLPEAPCAEGGA